MRALVVGAVNRPSAGVAPNVLEFGHCRGGPAGTPQPAPTCRERLHDGDRSRNGGEGRNGD